MFPPRQKLGCSPVSLLDSYCGLCSWLSTHFVSQTKNRTEWSTGGGDEFCEWSFNSIASRNTLFHCREHMMWIIILLQHLTREFYAYDGSIEKSDHGLMYLPFDANGARHIQNIPEIKALKLQHHDPEYAYCGFPYYIPMINLLKYVR